MEPTSTPLRLYTQASGHAPLDWSWVRGQLVDAPTYWVVASGDGHPHPRPVWGVWIDEGFFLSIGSPVLRRQLAANPNVTVHLDSGVDVVIVEGRAASEPGDQSVAIAQYDAKYDWSYDVDVYGAFTVVDVTDVFAWRVSGPAGRDSFRETGRWVF